MLLPLQILLVRRVVRRERKGKVNYALSLRRSTLAKIDGLDDDFRIKRPRWIPMRPQNSPCQVRTSRSLLKFRETAVFSNAAHSLIPNVVYRPDRTIQITTMTYLSTYLITKIGKRRRRKQRERIKIQQNITNISSFRPLFRFRQRRTFLLR